MFDCAKQSVRILRHVTMSGYETRRDTMLRYIAIVVFCMVPLFAEETEVKEDTSLIVWNSCKDELYKNAKDYLQKFAPAGHYEKWLKNINERINDAGHKTIADFALDWMSGAEKKLKAKEQTAIITACCYFIAFVDTNEAPPTVARSRISKENFDSLSKWLKDRVAGVPDTVASQ